MNSKGKIRNFNRESGHRVAMFTNMIKSFNEHGKLETTLPKAKFLKDMLQKGATKIYLVKTANRKGDNAPMAILLNEAKFNSMNTKPEKSSKSKK